MALKAFISVSVLVALGSALQARADDAPRSTAEPQLVFVAGPHYSMEAGVRTSVSAQALLFSYDAWLSQAIDFQETGVPGKILGVLGRAVKLELVDLPLVTISSDVAHEVFGHGARLRELGIKPRYVFHPVSPYSFLVGDTLPPGTLFNPPASVDANLLEKAGGPEAQYEMARWTLLRAIQGGGFMHYSDSLSYITNKLVYGNRFFSNLDQPNVGSTGEGGDPDDYLSFLQQRFNRLTPQDRDSMAARLKLAYLWNYLDPTFWISVYAGVVRYLYWGERWSRLPEIAVGRFLFLPAARFNLSPFGAEHYLDLMGTYGGSATLDVYGRLGSSGLARNYGIGAQVLGVQPWTGWSFGGALDLWYQTAISVTSDPAVRGDVLGVNVAASLEWRPLNTVGVVGKLGYKTPGYVMGEPVPSGIYGYVGLSVTPAAPTDPSLRPR